jgi:hypothetical protein
MVYSYKTFVCELCKYVIPDKVKVDNTTYSLVDIQIPENNYVIFETYLVTNNVKTMFMYIVHMKDKTSVRVGRSPDADVHISDISVSRHHAELKLANGHFYINDAGSKFGTLVMVGTNFLIVPYKPLSIQTRRHFFKFSLKKTFVSYMLCYK